jgi:hypothetical protein
MESATLTRQPAGPATPPASGTPSVGARLAALPWPACALGLLAVATVVGGVVYPTYPNYDSYYSLVWGRELLDGSLPSFDVYRAPTQHPLAVAFGAVLSLFGDVADRIMVWCTLASFVALCAGVYRLARTAFTPLIGLVAAALLVTRFDFPSLAARAYIDVPYLALVVWAAAFELDRPRRGGIVWVLLVLAGLLRPEAWLLAGAYWIWMNARRGVALADRLRWSLWTWLAAGIWVMTDWIVTGDPLFSQNHTSGLAEELGRTQDVSQLPSSMRQFFLNLAKAPVVYAGIAGFLLALWLVPRRVVMPAVLWLMGTGTFVMVGLGGLSVIDRYLLVPAMMTMVFAAVAIAGWTMLERGRLRTAWMGLAVLAVAYGAGFTATRVNFSVFDRDLELRGNLHPALVDVLDRPEARAAVACGPISVPNHKLLPEVRWVLDLGPDQVLARSSTDVPQARGGAVYVHGRAALLRQALVETNDRPRDSIPSLATPTFTRQAVSKHYGFYGGC